MFRNNRLQVVIGELGIKFIYHVSLWTLRHIVICRRCLNCLKDRWVTLSMYLRGEKVRIPRIVLNLLHVFYMNERMGVESLSTVNYHIYNEFTVFIGSINLVISFSTR